MKNPFEPHMLDDEQAHQFLAVQGSVTALYEAIKENTPSCAEQTLAIRKLEEAAMWANKAIAFRGERYL